MDKILQYKEAIVQGFIIILPILSMLIPKMISDGRTRKLLGSIELGADLKSNAYSVIIKEIAELKDLAKEIIDGRDVLDEVKVKFMEIVEEIGIIDDVKTDITALKNNLITTMELVQELLVETHNTINVKVVLEEQNEQIKELKELVNKLNTRLGGK